VLVGIGRAGRGGPTTGQHLTFIAPLLLGQTLLNLLFQADITLLRAFASDSAAAAGLAPMAADPLVGAYRATQMFCFLPYQLLIAVTFILFPMLATAFRDGDRAAVARYVETGVRIALVLAGLMVSVTSGLAGPLLTLVFGADTAALAERPMQLLTIGFGAFAIFGILTTVLNSLKHERKSAVITAIAAALVALLCYLRVRGAPFGPDLLWRTAIATSAGLALATVGAAFLVKRAAGAVVPPITPLRVLLALGIAIAVARFLPVRGPLVTIGASAVIALVYVVVLIATGELGRRDIENVRTVLSRRARPR
jgi:stage V sporulation protein B